MEAFQLDSRSADLRARIIDGAYDLMSRRGVRDVTLAEVAERAGVALEDLTLEFSTHDAVVVAVLEAREQRWTVERVEAGALAAGGTPEQQLLGIFDVFDEWFNDDEFDGCTFINVLLEVGWAHPLGQASIMHLSNIRTMVARLAKEAGIRDADEFALSWHILMKGSILSAAEGDGNAAQRARTMATALIAAFRATPGAQPAM